MRKHCWLCDKTITGTHWSVRLKQRGKVLAGVYCSKRCAQMNSWGPLFVGSKPIIISKIRATEI